VIDPTGDGSVAPGLELVAVRRLIEPGVDAWLPLAPGDRALVAAGESVVPGAPVAEHLRDGRLLDGVDGTEGRPGGRWTGNVQVGARRRHAATATGELLYEAGGRWRVVAGEHFETIESPIAGIVHEVQPGVGIRVRAAGAAIRGRVALGGISRGRLEVATGPNGELLPRALDVGAAGSILVVGARIDAESLTRARAMGVRGIVVATLPSKDRRDFGASESRQRAGLHPVAPFGVLVLHGSVRRPIAAPLMALFESLVGTEVAILGRPAALVFDPNGVPLPLDPPDTVHARSGPLAGRVGRWAGLAGLRRFPGGSHLEAGFVRFGDDQPVAVPLADLERYG